MRVVRARKSGNIQFKRRGFTVVELVVVVTVLAILVTGVVIGYSGWRGSVQRSQVKADLLNAATAMQSAATFSDAYPSELPDTFTPSPDVVITVSEASATKFCLDGASQSDESIVYYVDQQFAQGKSPEEGLCSERPADSPPTAPTNLAVDGIGANNAMLSWTASSGIVSQYILQCAQDAGFVYELKQSTSSTTSGTVSGLSSVTTAFCRVQAENSAGKSPWSVVISADSGEYLPPSGLVASNQTMSSLVLTWSPDLDNLGEYTAQCAKDTGFTSGLVSADIGALTTTFTDLDFNTTYYCRVRSVGPDGTSAWSTSLTTATNSAYGSLPVGTSIDGYWTEPPVGFLFEEGQAVSRTQYADLFAVIGTTYGSGDGSTTFNIPDSRTMTTVALDSGDSDFSPVGATYGSRTHTLTIAEMPSHTHSQNSHDHNNGKPNPYVTSGPSGIQVFSASGSAFGFHYNTNASSTSPSTAATNQNAGGGLYHANIQPSIVKRSAIKYATIDPSADTLPAGTSINGYWSSAPTGYLVENGSAVSRTTYAQLFSAIGTTYGTGNGSTTFNLPDSRGRATVNLKTTDAEFSSLGATYGTKNHQLTTSEMPSHNHTQNPHNHNGGYANPYLTDGSLGGIAVSSLNGAAYGFTLRAHPSVTATNQNTGGGGSHNNVQPSIVKLSVIKTGDATGTQPVAVGTSISSYANSIPAGYLYEDGSTVSRTTYADLFAVIGTTYGSGDGSTTFKIPDSQGRLAVNLKSGDSSFGTMGQKTGNKTELLTVSMLPIHTHTQNSHNHNSGISYVSDGSFGGTAVWTAPGASFGFKIVAPTSVTATNNSTGGGGAHNNIQPSIVKRMLIKY